MSEKMHNDELPEKRKDNPFDDEFVDEFEEDKHASQFIEIMKRLLTNKAAILGLAVFVIMVLLAILAPIIAPYSPYQMDMANLYSSPTWKHLCGTDQLGRDIFSRLLYGARYSLGLGIAAQILTLFFSILLGSISGFFGGVIDNIIQRTMDIFQAIPGLLLAIIIISALGNNLFSIIVAMGVGGVPMMTRILRSNILTVRDREFLEAATSINCSRTRKIKKYILPNAISPLIVTTTMGIGMTIMTVASLSYIGLGMQPPAAEWGAMITAAKDYLRNYPYMLVSPGIAIVFTVFSVNMFGDGLRDAMDPKLKR
jgi:peptide/nickel transport system permease protein